MKKLQNHLKRNPDAEDIVRFAKKCLLPEEGLFRIYYYDCPPFDGEATTPFSKKAVSFTEHPQNERMKLIHHTLALTDHIAFRRGELSFKGWVVKKYKLDKIVRAGRTIAEEDFTPDFQQKRVDLMMGLDIAWLSSKGIVERIIMVTADSDLIPAMKFARREGVQVILVTLGHSIKSTLREHCDEFGEVESPT